MKERFLKKTGIISSDDLERFNAFDKSKQSKIVQLLENGFTLKEIKSYSIWNA